MLVSFRSALLVLAALSASSVAPAQVVPAEQDDPAVVDASLPKISYPGDVASDSIAVPEPVTPTDQGADETTLPGKPTGELSDMVAQLRTTDAGSHEIDCLAIGIYFESKSEPLSGQLAVGKVIANRANSKGRFPPSYCGVLFQRGQFSFIHAGRLPAVPRGSRQWQTAVAIAKIVDQGLKDSPAERALFFHAKRVSPGWHLTRVASIGNHIFYR